MNEVFFGIEDKMFLRKNKNSHKQKKIKFEQKVYGNMGVRTIFDLFLRDVKVLRELSHVIEFSFATIYL